MGPDHIGVELVLGELLLPDIPRRGPVTRPTEHLYSGHLLHLGGDEDGGATENYEVDEIKVVILVLVLMTVTLKTQKMLKMLMTMMTRRVMRMRMCSDSDNMVMYCTSSTSLAAKSISSALLVSHMLLVEQQKSADCHIIHPTSLIPRYLIVVASRSHYTQSLQRSILIMDIATYRLNWPRGQCSENHLKCITR